jgi:hypothetical protein
VGLEQPLMPSAVHEKKFRQSRYQPPVPPLSAKGSTRPCRTTSPNQKSSAPSASRSKPKSPKTANSSARAAKRSRSFGERRKVWANVSDTSKHHWLIVSEINRLPRNELFNVALSAAAETGNAVAKSSSDLPKASNILDCCVRASPSVKGFPSQTGAPWEA